MPNVKIEMSAATVSGLLRSGFCLYAFRAVQSSDLAGRPILWQRRQDYSTETLVGWQAQYTAYTSSSPIVANARVVPGFSVQAAPGQILNVQAGGIGTVAGGGPATAISINNQTETQLTCGLSQAGQDNGVAALPCCAFPLYGLHLQEITPLEKVLLTFSTRSIQPGTVIGDCLESLSARLLASFSSSVQVDLTGVSERTVTYDLNTGWSWDGSLWACSFPAATNLVPLLIEPSAEVRGVRA